MSRKCNICNVIKEEGEMIREFDACIKCVSKMIEYIFLKGLTFVPTSPAYFLLPKRE